MIEPKVKVFLDANVLIAGSMSRTGASYAILRLAEVGLISLYVSRTVVDEVERNLHKKLPEALPDFVHLMTVIRPKLLPDPPPAESARWEQHIEAKDAPILAAAVLSPAERLLTLNTKDFTAEVAAQSELIIQTPGEFVSTIRKLIQVNL